MLQTEMRDLHDHLHNNGIMPLMFIFAATVLVMFGSLIVKGFRGQLF